MAATIHVPENVREILARSTITADRLVLPPGQLDRKTYEAVNKAISAAGGTWDRQAAAHIFASDPRLALGLAVEVGTVVHRKNTLQAFYTPRGLADRLADLADPQPGDRVLEPSCGDGALVAAMLRREPSITITAYEIDLAAMREAACKAGSAEWRGTETDFLAVEPVPLYDVAVMNPPFAKDADIDHVLHAWEFVRPGGRLVSIMSVGWQHADRLKKRKAFRAFVESLGGDVTPLGDGAFKESGTSVHTVMLRLDKPAA
jgi:methylase of polypeptide subunit release factors